MLFIDDGCVIIGPIPSPQNRAEGSPRAGHKLNAAVQCKTSESDSEAPADLQVQEEIAHRKKRRRKSKYVPNEREQEANVRAAKITPFLKKALQSLQTWMSKNLVSQVARVPTA